MSYENWVRNSWLDKQSSDREEIGRLLAIADARLDDYRKAVKAKLSTDVQLALAYDAARASATAALRAAGYRVVRGSNEHYRTIEALEFSIDPEKKIIRTLDTLRRKLTRAPMMTMGLYPKERPITRARSRHRSVVRLKTGFGKILRTKSDWAPI